MGKYTSIAEVGMAIVRLLRKELVPDTLQNPDAIGLCSPTDRGDYMVGIYLYDIRESEELRVNTMIARGAQELLYPPSYVNLYYMITVTSTGDIKYRSEEEHKILGRIVQVLADYPCLDRETLEPVTSRKQLDVELSMQNLTLEDKMRIYSVPNAGYKLSLFYRAAPVEIESTKSRRTVRVMEAEFGLEEKR
ncbi:DUF4255 domain-containing protein [uncultured Clostridium sp.]|uniref:DUF4255 domain-containing protein n=1 Tax=uncultured Clostridium sp. TaxID=59620 RepID=UPI002586072B|nr:DUF4255 domain-containing protein [uncultured Clostridium sp.]